MCTRIAGLILVLAVTGSGQSKSDTALSGVVHTAHFDIRFRPLSRAAAGVDRVAVMAERDLAAMSAQLAIKVEGRYVLWVYDTEKELSTITGTTGNAGFSVGDASHVPFDNDQTRFHEMVHIVAFNRLQKSGDEARNLFFAEGLANGLLEFVHGVHVHAVAGFYKKIGRLPPIGELTGAKDFYAWQAAHPKFNAYDVAGSWFRWLLDTHGADATKRYYTGTPALAAFGSAEADLEKGWHAALEAHPLRPEVETLLRQRNGEPAAFPPWQPARGLPADIVGKPADWTSLLGAELHPAEPAAWSRKDAAIVGTSTKTTWTVCDLGAKKYGNCVVRARIATPGSNAIQVRIGAGNQAMLVNGTFVYRGDRPVGSSDLAAMTSARRSTDLVVVRRGGKIEVWIDEVKTLTVGADEAPALIGIGFVGGAVTFEDIKVRTLP